MNIKSFLTKSHCMRDEVRSTVRGALKHKDTDYLVAALHELDTAGMPAHYWATIACEDHALMPKDTLLAITKLVERMDGKTITEEHVYEARRRVSKLLLFQTRCCRMSANLSFKAMNTYDAPEKLPDDFHDEQTWLPHSTWTYVTTPLKFTNAPHLPDHPAVKATVDQRKQLAARLTGMTNWALRTLIKGWLELGSPIKKSAARLMSAYKVLEAVHVVYEMATDKLYECAAGRDDSEQCASGPVLPMHTRSTSVIQVALHELLDASREAEYVAVNLCDELKAFTRLAALRRSTCQQAVLANAIVRRMTLYHTLSDGTKRMVDHAVESLKKIDTCDWPVSLNATTYMPPTKKKATGGGRPYIYDVGIPTYALNWDTKRGRDLGSKWKKTSTGACVPDDSPMRADEALLDKFHKRLDKHPSLLDHVASINEITETSLSGEPWLDEARIACVRHVTEDAAAKLESLAQLTKTWAMQRIGMAGNTFAISESSNNNDESGSESVADALVHRFGSVAKPAAPCRKRRRVERSSRCSNSDSDDEEDRRRSKQPMKEVDGGGDGNGTAKRRVKYQTPIEDGDEPLAHKTSLRTYWRRTTGELVIGPCRTTVHRNLVAAMYAALDSLELAQVPVAKPLSLARDTDNLFLTVRPFAEDMDPLINKEFDTMLDAAVGAVVDVSEDAWVLCLARYVLGCGGSGMDSVLYANGKWAPVDFYLDAARTGTAWADILGYASVTKKNRRKLDSHMKRNGTRYTERLAELTLDKPMFRERQSCKRRMATLMSLTVTTSVKKMSKKMA